MMNNDHREVASFGGVGGDRRGFGRRSLPARHNIREEERGLDRGLERGFTHDMPSTERDLGDGAKWKLIQKNTFTRWANEFLKKDNKVIGDLDTDLSDGVRLVALVEILSGKRIPKHNRRPSHTTQRQDNISICLEFLQTEEKIKFVNIDSSDIIGGNQKLILGLIWTLILHYSISMPTWDGEDNSNNNREQTPKQKLLNWITSRIPDKPIYNFTSDWNNGIAIGALVDAVAPGLCPDWQTWNPKNSLSNATEAMAAAEQWLDVPQLIKPAEVCDAMVDEMSIMTYLSQFPNAKLKQGAPIRPPTNPSRVRAFGPGIEPKGNTVGTPARITVETFNAGRGDVDVRILNPHGTQEPCQVVFNNDKLMSYLCTYTPTTAGQYRVGIRFAGQDILKSPFAVQVEASQGDASKVNVRGPGIEKSGVMVNRKTNFDVFTKNAGNGVVDVSILDPTGRKDVVRPAVHRRADEVWYVEYTPVIEGLHKIGVVFGGKQVPGSPFPVMASAGGDAHKCYVTGRGIQPKGVRVDDACDFKVHTEDAGGNADVHAKVLRSDGSEERVNVRKLDPKTYECSYIPRKVGQYVVTATYGGQPVGQSPFRVDVGPKKDTRIKAVGPGLVHGLVGYPACFAVDTDGESGVLGFSIEGPSQAKIDCKDNGDGSADLSYWPTAPGIYAVHILCNEEDIPRSPFMAEISPTTTKYDPTKVDVSGHGVQKTGVTVNKWAEFVVDVRRAGQAPLHVVALGTDFQPVEVIIQDNRDGTYNCRYMPQHGGRHTIFISYGNVTVPNSPFRVLVKEASNPGRVRVHGPCIERPVVVRQPTHFFVDCSNAGPGDVSIALTNERGIDVPVNTTDNRDNTFRIDYEPESTGTYTANIYFDDHELPDSPYKIHVQPGIDTSKIAIKGLEDRVFVESVNDFTVDARSVAPQGQGKVKALLTDPSGVRSEVHVSNNKDGTYTGSYIPVQKGLHKLDVTYDGANLFRSPYNINVQSGIDATRVKALGAGSPFHSDIVDGVDSTAVRCYGPGIEQKGVRKGQPGNFTIDASHAGPGIPEVIAVDNMGRKRPGQVKPRGDGMFDATYFLDTEGPCKVEVYHAGRPVPGSPFDSRILPPYDANKVHVTGQGVSPTGVIASLPTTFLMDTRDAGLADHDIIILDPIQDFVRPTILDKGDRTFVVTYTPCDVGRYTIMIKYGGDPVPLSPFYVMTSPTGDAGQVKILGGVQSVIPLGQPYTLGLDTSRAGVGNVTCNIRGPNDSDVDIDLIDKRNGLIDVVYTPRLLGVYVVNLKFGGQPIPNGQFSQQVVDPSGPNVKKEETSGVGKYNPADFCIPVGPIFNFVSAEILAPSGKKHLPKLDDNHDGTVKIIYNPTEVGLHRLDVDYNKTPVYGSPFHFYVHNLHSGQVIAYGPGLSHGILGRPCKFTIITKDAGPGALSLQVEGPSKAEINTVDNKDGTCFVTYSPTAAGEYSIFIKFSDRHISGSPFTAKIMPPVGEELKSSQALLGASSEVSLKVTELDIANLTATIRSPSGAEEPCALKRLANGQLGFSFKPREVGDYLVSVFRNGKHIPNSPFRISVSESQIGNATQVKAYGKGLSKGTANEINEFYIDTRNAGYGNLSLSIEGPSKADMDCKDNEDNTCRVMYRPTEPGSYIINIKFAEEHIPGSPYLVAIEGEPTGKVTERIVKQKDAGDLTHVGSNCELNLRIPGASRYDLEASVTNPSGKTEPCNVQERLDNNYCVQFIPREMGVHLVSIRHKGSQVPGSPFPFTVGPIANGGSDKVRALGPGLENGEVNIPCIFNVYTREAGTGGLSIAIEGPSKAEIDFQDRKDGSCEVGFVCSEPGDYLVSVKFNDNHIPGSPFKVHVASSAKKLTIHELQGRNLEVNKPAAYAVDLNGAWGKMDARVIAPSGAEEQAIVQELDKNRCAIRFIPRENGFHTIHVRCNGSQVPGSPYQIHVGQEEGNSKLVKASGEGLSRGMTGQLCKFLVNTARAGPGALAVTIDGPSKVQLSCYEAHDGYEFMYTPTEPGEYHVNIKYAGNTHIPGSPFQVHVEGMGLLSSWSDQSDIVVESVTKSSTTQKYASARKLHDLDVSKITVAGAGLQRATANKEATFTVDTARAGYNVLMVGIIGGNVPCEEVLVKHIGQKQYSVSYTIHERGDYHLMVKWGDQHIPGSPFKINVQ